MKPSFPFSNRNAISLTHTAQSVTLPNDLCEGIWLLQVRTQCGCYRKLIGIKCADMQTATAMAAQADNRRPATTVCIGDTKDDKEMDTDNATRVV